MSEVVTGDAVVVEVRVAQMLSRAAALLIDMIVQIVLMVGTYFLLLGFSVISDPALFAAVNIIMVVTVMVGYPVIFETLTRGRSLGKLAMGLRVVGDDGGPERFRQALMRGLAGVLEFWLLYGAPALITSLISQKGKRLGDLFAGTIVISERVPRDNTQMIVMPPPLAAWAATLELSQLPDGVATAARQYLARWHDLAPAVQHEMGVRIATQMASYVTPAAPNGVPPHAYLSAVLAERRRREEVRLARRTQQPAAPMQPTHSPAPQPPMQPTHGAAPQPPMQPYGPAARPPAPWPGQPAPQGYGAAPPPTGRPVHPGPPMPPQPGPSMPPPRPTPEPPATTPGGFAPPA